MPTCPNCGSYIPLGDHSCSCGTTISYDESYEEDSGYASPISLDENPYDYDFLNDLYHEDVNVVYLEQMNKGIAEIERKYNAQFKRALTGKIFILEFSVEAKYFDAIIRASYDTSYGYNDLELIRDIVTPDLSKLYSSDDFKTLVKKTEREINSRFMHCSLGFIGDELIISVFFEGLKTFFLNGYDLNFME